MPIAQRLLARPPRSGVKPAANPDGSAGTGPVRNATAFGLPRNLLALWVVPVLRQGGDWVGIDGWQHLSQEMALPDPPFQDDMACAVHFDFTGIQATTAAVFVLAPDDDRVFNLPVRLDGVEDAMAAAVGAASVSPPAPPPAAPATGPNGPDAPTLQALREAFTLQRRIGGLDGALITAP